MAILYAVVKLPPIPPLGERRGRAKVLDGIRYLRLKPLLLMTFVVDIIAMVCGMPRALFPQMAQETFGGPVGGGLALGMLNAGLAIGSLIGGLTGGWIHRIYRQGIAIVVAILLWGLSMTLFGTTSVLWLAVLYLAIGGWADLVSAVYRSTILQVTATDEMRGRIQGVFTVVVAGGPRLADLVHGVVADATSTAIRRHRRRAGHHRADPCRGTLRPQPLALRLPPPHHRPLAPPRSARINFDSAAKR